MQTSAALDIWLLYGERGSGKTSFCLQLARHPAFATAQTPSGLRSGQSVGGALCPGIFDDSGEKQGCVLLDCRLAGTLHFSNHHPDCSALPLLGSRRHKLTGPRWRVWSFDAAVFSMGNQAILESLRRPDELTIIDEIGPLETELRQGFQPTFLAVLQAARAAGSALRLQTLDAAAITEAPQELTGSNTASESARPKTVLISVRPDLLDHLVTMLTKP